jgi:TBC1 domain family protein 5
MLGKPQDQLRPTSSEFPSGIDRIVAATHKQQIPPIPIPKNQHQQKMNLDMGHLMAQCISILEKEIFENTTKKEEQVVPQELDDVADEEPVQETKEETPAQQNEAEMIMALVGLKHVRDVLLGKQPQFDASVIDIKPPSPNDDWDMVDPKQIPEPEQPKPEQPKPSIEQPKPSPEQPKPSPVVISTPPKPSVFVPPTTSSSLFEGYEKEKPLPPVTYVPTNPAPPKQHIKYRIEDLLSDPDLQLPSPKTSNKFKWMLEQEEEKKIDEQDLFKTENKSPIRRPGSFIKHKKSVMDSVTESTVDPLDAKNMDSRKAYEL